MDYRGPQARTIAWAWALWRYWRDGGSTEHATRLGALVLIDHVCAILKRDEVDCVLDVGANAGQYAMALRRGGYRGRIVSFEPQPGPCALLTRLARRDAAWTVCPYALGATDGEMALELRAVNVFTSFRPTTAYATERYGQQVASEGVVTVPINRLSSVLPKIAGDTPRRFFLKMDTQGYDLEVFAGAADVLPRIVGLQSELSFMSLYEGAPAWREAIASYERAGFVLSALAPVGHDATTGALIEMDCVMVRPR
jgi:FkbM family methyltransferase